MDDETKMAAALGSTWTAAHPWDFLSRLTRLGNRMGGSEGERRAAGVVADAFREAGVDDVHEESFEMQAWSRGSSSLSLVDDERAFETVALPYSPSGDVTGELVDVGHGTPDEIDDCDIDGKIAVASTTTPPGGRFVHRMEKFGYAVERGAEAFVFVNHVPGQLPPTGSLTFDEEAVAPAVGVSKESGAWLTDYADEGAVARLTVDAETTDGESQNVVGHVGPDTDEELLVVAHYDAHDIAEGALDNGCGIAVVVTAARILARLDLPVGVRVAAVGCEETGLTGAENLADELDHDAVKAVVNVDGAGRFRDLVAISHTSEATARVAREMAAETRHPVHVKTEPHPFSDQWPFVRAGVPSLQLHSDSGERGRGWGHTHADTRDKVDDRNIREHGMLAAMLVKRLADEDEVPRLDTDELADAFRAEDFETGMRAANLWPADWE
ncbi:M28 family peptidase [Halogeometricum limi]|uniref:Carboxypeptidase Q n=1 Tax=Halogeometricum limi TaxID=555875 RepID=A0A1I6H5R5_9EURY|nr:M28 family metallopeptidase [Halogeometricum limi]SFR49742.1 Zn-dependent amino-or carboxypeptidase, M28 family [Halogeometricum limi]